MKSTENKILNAGLNHLYNVWFRKYRDGQLNDVEWETCVSELEKIRAEYQSETLEKIGMALLEELTARSRTGYGRKPG